MLTARHEFAAALGLLHTVEADPEHAVCPSVAGGARAARDRRLRTRDRPGRGLRATRPAARRAHPRLRPDRPCGGARRGARSGDRGRDLPASTVAGIRHRPAPPSRRPASTAAEPAADPCRGGRPAGVVSRRRARHHRDAAHRAPRRAAAAQRMRTDQAAASRRRRAAATRRLAALGIAEHREGPGAQHLPQARRRLPRQRRAADGASGYSAEPPARARTASTRSFTTLAITATAIAPTITPSDRNVSGCREPTRRAGRR